MQRRPPRRIPMRRMPPDRDFDPVQLAKGTEVELEHTPSRELAKEIAKAHLIESRDYYIKLEQMEKELAKEKKWFKTKGHIGWKKSYPVKTRREIIKRAVVKEGYMPVFHKLLGLANVTQDKETEQKARADYQWMQRNRTELERL
jgi:hypothetical protein